MRLCTPFSAKADRHDFKLFRASGVQFHPSTESLQDKGYWGIQTLYANSRIPRKKPRGGQLTQADRTYNRNLARELVLVEQVNRRLKIFKILSKRYRNRRRRFGLR